MQPARVLGSVGQVQVGEGRGDEVRGVGRHTPGDRCQQGHGECVLGVVSYGCG